MSAAGIEAKIFTALASNLDTYVASNPIAVAYPGKAFTPTVGKPWLRPWMLSAPAIAYTISGSIEYRGIWQTDVFGPEQEGQGPTNEIASAIIAQYVRGTTLREGGVNVCICDPPYLGPAMQEPGWLHIPVNIRFRAYVN